MCLSSFKKLDPAGQVEPQPDKKTGIVNFKKNPKAQWDQLINCSAKKTDQLLYLSC